MRKIAMKISVTLGIIVLSLLAGLPPADAINWTFTDNVTVQGAGGLTTPVVALPGGDVQNQIDAKQAADADLATLSDLGNWKFSYSNGSSNIVAGAFGANGTVLCFTGTASAPTPCTPTFTAPGSDTHMIFNDVGVPGANSGFTYNKTLKNAYLDNTFRAAAYETTQSATVAGYFRMYELSGNGSNYIGFTVPDAITATYSLKLPDATPNSEILNCAAPSGGVSACSWSSGGTASAITYGTAPVVDASGEIAIDGTAGQVKYYGASSAYVLDPRRTENATFKTPTSGEKAKFRKPHGMTVTSVGCVTDAATSVVLDVQECNANGASCGTILSGTITCGTTYGTGSVSDSSIAAANYVFLSLGTVSGTPGYLYVDFNYTVTGE